MNEKYCCQTKIFIVGSLILEDKGNYYDYPSLGFFFSTDSLNFTRFSDLIRITTHKNNYYSTILFTTRNRWVLLPVNLLTIPALSISSIVTPPALSVA